MSINTNCFEKDDFIIGYTNFNDSNQLLKKLFKERADCYNQAYNKEASQDYYDEFYSHIYVYHKPSNRVIGAYRITIMQDVINQFGMKCLYTNSLFEYDNTFLNDTKKTLEIGRMFIIKAFQKDYRAFAMLWAGVVFYISKHPGCRYLVGALNIDSSYTKDGVMLIKNYCQKDNSFAWLEKKIKPKYPIIDDNDSIKEPEQINNIKTLNDLSNYLKQTEPNHKGVPILMKKYKLLTGNFISFSYNKELATTDVFTAVKLKNLPRQFLVRLMGNNLVEKMFDSMQNTSATGNFQD